MPLFLKSNPKITQIEKKLSNCPLFLNKPAYSLAEGMKRDSERRSSVIKWPMGQYILIFLFYVINVLLLLLADAPRKKKRRVPSANDRVPSSNVVSLDFFPFKIEQL